MSAFANMALDDLLDLRAALTEAIDKHGKFPEDDEDRERVTRWQVLAEQIDEHSDLERDEPPAHERFRAQDIERLGWLVLYWSRIPAQNQDAIYQFIEAIGNSSVPEACGIVGASITDELAPEDC